MKKNKIYIYIWAVFITAVMVFPFLWGFLLSFKDNFEIFNHPLSLPKKFDFHSYLVTFNNGHVGVLFKNSLIVTVISVSIGMVTIFLSSFSIARLNHKHQGMSDFFYYLFLAATAVPVFVLLKTMYDISLFLGKVNSHWGIDSLFGLILPYIALQIPFSTLLLVGGMRGLPVEMEEAAIIDGCGLLGVIFRVDLPLLMPIISALFIFTFLGIWNEFPIASIQLNSTVKYTIPMALSFFKQEYSSDYGSMLRAVILILIPQLLFFFIFQKKIVEGIATDGLKG